MIVLYKKENLLYAKVLMDLRLPIPYQTKLFGKGKREMLMLPDEVMHVLTHNGNIRIWNGDKFIKMNLGQFYDVVNNKQYKVENVPEPKKEEPKPVQPKIVEQPKQQEVKEEVVKEQPKQQEVKEEPKKQEQSKEEKPKQNDYNNKKQRHNNNNNKQQNNQGGDK